MDTITVTFAGKIGDLVRHKDAHEFDRNLHGRIVTRAYEETKDSKKVLYVVRFASGNCVTFEEWELVAGTPAQSLPDFNAVGAIG